MAPELSAIFSFLWEANSQNLQANCYVWDFGFFLLFGNTGQEQSNQPIYSSNEIGPAALLHGIYVPRGVDYIDNNSRRL